MPRIVCRSFPGVATILLAQESPTPIMSGNGRRGRLPGPCRPLSAPPNISPLGRAPAERYRFTCTRHCMTPRFKATGRTGSRRSGETPQAPVLPIVSESQSRTAPPGVPSADGTSIRPLPTLESATASEGGGDLVARLAEAHQANRGPIRTIRHESSLVHLNGGN